MNQDVIGILKLCRLLDMKAVQVYSRLASISRNEELSLFWQEMSEEENVHVRFWEKLLAIALEDGLPLLFEEPAETLRELMETYEKISVIGDNIGEKTSILNQFLFAYRLEFCLINPVFESLFRFMKRIENEDPTVVDGYESHLNKFIEMMCRQGLVSEELDLLGETLLKLWRENRRLSTLSSLDPLTTLLNRRGFNDTITPLVEYARRKDLSVGFMMIDIDNFKKVNDSYGHQKGDEVIGAIGRIIGNHTRKSDVVGRFGGEEFIIMLMDFTPETGRTVSEKLRMLVEKEMGKLGIPVTISIGVSGGRIQAAVEKGISSLIASADECLYLAKAEGKNRVMCAAACA